MLQEVAMLGLMVSRLKWYFLCFYIDSLLRDSHLVNLDISVGVVCRRCLIFNRFQAFIDFLL